MGQAGLHTARTPSNKHDYSPYQSSAAPAAGDLELENLWYPWKTCNKQTSKRRSLESEVNNPRTQAHKQTAQTE
eukprot:scaffold272015_cov12-Tisochrysis_lutea.AAC.1